MPKKKKEGKNERQKERRGGGRVPGNLITLTFFPSSTNRCSKSFTCVVLPLRSKPSSTMNAPRFTLDGVSEAIAAVARSLIEAMLQPLSKCEPWHMRLMAELGGVEGWTRVGGRWWGDGCQSVSPGRAAACGGHIHVKSIHFAQMEFMHLAPLSGTDSDQNNSIIALINKAGTALPTTPGHRSDTDDENAKHQLLPNDQPRHKPKPKNQKKQNPHKNAPQ